jgi:hypothetical protein
MKEPTDLISMQAALQLFDSLIADIPKEEEEFPKIQEQRETLGKPLNVSPALNKGSSMRHKIAGVCSKIQRSTVTLFARLQYDLQVRKRGCLRERYDP